MSPLNTLELPHKIAITGFLLIFALGIGAGSLLFGSQSGQSLLAAPFSPELVRLKYAATPFENAVKTSMREYVRTEADVEALCGWIQAGSTRDGYYDLASPILERDCSQCHGKVPTVAGVGSLYTYADALPYVTTQGVPLGKLSLRVHVHLFGIGLLLLILTALVNRTSMPAFRKSLISGALFGLLAVDALSQYLAKWHALFAYLTWGAALFMNLGIVFSILLVLRELWLGTEHADEGVES